MFKTLQLIVGVILLSGCVTTPEKLCRETNLKTIKQKEKMCEAHWMDNMLETPIGSAGDPRVMNNHMELIQFNCKAKAKYKSCK
jgi:hypothetical protein